MKALQMTRILQAERLKQPLCVTKDNNILRRVGEIVWVRNKAQEEVLFFLIGYRA